MPLWSWHEGRHEGLKNEEESVVIDLASEFELDGVSQF